MCLMDMFTALADPTRRDILEMLAIKGQLAAGDIYDRFDISAPAISQHLKVLREADLVRVEKQAQLRLYKINPAKISEFEHWIEKLRQSWEEKFSRLDALLEREKQKVR
jgi:DNA-binding transcriptional ArsR family regulator